MERRQFTREFKLEAVRCSDIYVSTSLAKFSDNDLRPGGFLAGVPYQEPSTADAALIAANKKDKDKFANL